MVAQLLQNVDGLERLRPGSSEQLLDLGRRNKEAVESELNGTEPTEHDVFVLDGH